MATLRQPAVSTKVTARTPPPTRGLFIGSPTQAPDNTCAEMINFLPGRSDCCMVRGPATVPTSLEALASADSYFAAINNNNAGLAVSRVSSATGIVAHTKFGDVITTPDLNVNINGSAVTAGITAENVPGRRATKLGNFVYARSLTSATTKTVNGQLGVPQWNLLRLDGTAVAPTIYANAPKYFVDITNHVNRLFVAGGSDAAAPTTTVEPNTLFFSDVLPSAGAAYADAASSWQDDVSGLTNRIVVGSDDGTDCLIGMARIPAGLVIFKKFSTYVLYGSGPSNFTIKQMSRDVGCIGQDTIVEINNTVCFMTHKGYFMFDGSRFTRLSDNVAQEFVPMALFSSGLYSIVAGGGGVGAMSAVALGNDYIMIVMSQKITPATSITRNWILHIPTQSWARFAPGNITTLTGFSNTNPLAYVTTVLGGDNTLGSIFGFNLRGGWNLTLVANPEYSAQAAVLGSGSDLPYGNDKRQSSGALFSVPATITHRPLLLASQNGMMSQIHRIITEFRTLGPSNGATVLTLNLYNSNSGAAAIDAHNIAQTAQGTGTTPWERQRDVYDNFFETGDLAPEVVFTLGQAGTTFKAIHYYGTTVEFESARPLPSGW